ncbi:MAG: hypothetical protein ACLUI3_08985 [Christensenellales bacterium]
MGFGWHAAQHAGRSGGEHNAALAENGLPMHTVDEVRMFVGNGIGN